jgi:hypothetical protein
MRPWASAITVSRRQCSCPPVHRKVVGALEVDHVAPGLEQGVTGLEHPGRLPLQRKEDLALGHVAEERPGVPVRRRAGVTGRQGEPDGPGLGAGRDPGRRLGQGRDHLNAWGQVCVLSALVFLQTGTGFSKGCRSVADSSGWLLASRSALT